MDVEIRWRVEGVDGRIDLEQSIANLKELARLSASSSVPHPQVVALTLTINARVGYAEDGKETGLLSLTKCCVSGLLVGLGRDLA